MNEIATILQIVETKFIRRFPWLAVALKNLVQMYVKFDKELMLQGTKSYRSNQYECERYCQMDISRKSLINYNMDFNGTLPCISLTVQYNWAIWVSVLSCGRGFSNLKIVKHYVRSTMTEDRLVKWSAKVRFQTKLVSLTLLGCSVKWKFKNLYNNYREKLKSKFYLLLIRILIFKSVMNWTMN